MDNIVIVHLFNLISFSLLLEMTTFLHFNFTSSSNKLVHFSLYFIFLTFSSSHFLSFSISVMEQTLILVIMSLYYFKFITASRICRMILIFNPETCVVSIILRLCSTFFCLYFSETKGLNI